MRRRTLLVLFALVAVLFLGGLAGSGIPLVVAAMLLVYVCFIWLTARPPLPHRVLMPLAVLSLVIAMSAAVLAYASLWRPIGGVTAHGRTFRVTPAWVRPGAAVVSSESGVFIQWGNLYVHRERFTISRASSYDLVELPARHLATTPIAANWRGTLGFALQRGSSSPRGDDVEWFDFSVPLWFVVLAVATPWGVFYWRRRKRHWIGCCSTCGYNLTGNISGFCPECGTSTMRRMKA